MKSYVDKKIEMTDLSEIMKDIYNKKCILGFNI